MIDFDKILLEKYNCRRRLVEERDAEFITSLRSDISLAKHIHFNDGDVQKQIEWTRLYKEREKLGKEYYYIYMSHLRENNMVQQGFPILMTILV